MVMLFVLGLMDLWTSLYVFLLHFGITSPFLVVAHSAYLFGKGILFWGDWYSVIDIAISVYVILAALGMANIVVTSLCALFLFQKSVFTFKAHAPKAH